MTRRPFFAMLAGLFAGRRAVAKSPPALMAADPGFGNADRTRVAVGYCSGGQLRYEAILDGCPPFDMEEARKAFHECEMRGYAASAQQIFAARSANDAMGPNARTGRSGESMMEGHAQPQWVKLPE